MTWFEVVLNTLLRFFFVMMSDKRILLIITTSFFFLNKVESISLNPSTYCINWIVWWLKNRKWYKCRFQLQNFLWWSDVWQNLPFLLLIHWSIDFVYKSDKHQMCMHREKNPKRNSKKEICACLLETYNNIIAYLQFEYTLSILYNILITTGMRLGQNYSSVFIKVYQLIKLMMKRNQSKRTKKKNTIENLISKY